MCRNTPQCRYMAVYIFNCNICISLSFYPCTLILYSAPCGLPVFVNTQHGGKVLLLYPVMLLGSKPANFILTRKYILSDHVLAYSVQLSVF